jgi:hypothetical protein
MSGDSRIKRLRRRTRRVVLILLAGMAIYVSQYFALFWLAGYGIVSRRHCDLAGDTMFYPIQWCAYTPLPMSPYVAATAEWCHTRGEGKEIGWSEWYAYFEGVRTGNPPPWPR